MLNFSIGHSIGYDAINHRKNNTVSKIQNSVKYNSDYEVPDTSNSRSGILFEHRVRAVNSVTGQVTTAPFRISYNDSFTPENPILILETFDEEWNSTKIEININSIDPNNATGLEIMVLLSYHYKTNPDFGSERLLDFFINLGSTCPHSGRVKQDYLENPFNWNTVLHERMSNFFPYGQMDLFVTIKELLDVINKGRN